MMFRTRTDDQFAREYSEINLSTSFKLDTGTCQSFSTLQLLKSEEPGELYLPVMVEEAPSTDFFNRRVDSCRVSSHQTSSRK
jgi:hypothetical protein